MNVALLETAPRTEPGSMRRYAELLVEALELAAQEAGVTDLTVTRVCLAPEGERLRRWPRRTRSWRHHAGIAAAAMTLRKSAFDVFHVLDGSHGYVTRFLPRNQTVVTAHDIIPDLQARGKFPVPPPGHGARWLIKASLNGLRRATRVLVDSESTRRDLLDVGVPAGLLDVCYLANAMPRQQGVFRAAVSEEVSAVISQLPYIFHVGNNGFYKNRLGVVRIFAATRQSTPVQLVLAGPPPSAALTELVRELNVGQYVRFIVDPTDDDLRALYSNASLLLFPSYYEGFGWPPLEAMTCGCPVVASNRGSLPEVVGDAALTGDPNDIELMARHCLSILGDRPRAERLREAGFRNIERFTLEGMGRQVLRTYQEVLTGKATRPMVESSAVG